MARLFKLTLVLFLVPLFVSSQQYVLKPMVEEGVKSSFRGLSVVDNQIIWVSGSNGYVGKSLNDGAKQLQTKLLLSIWNFIFEHFISQYFSFKTS